MDVSRCMRGCGGAVNIEEAQTPLTVRCCRTLLVNRLTDVGAKVAWYNMPLLFLCSVGLSVYSRILARRIRKRVKILKSLGLMSFALLLFSSPVAAGCFQSDVRTYCCPVACHVKRSSKWYQADEVLRGCMRGLGCEGKGQTVGMTCHCK